MPSLRPGPRDKVARDARDAKRRATMYCVVPQTLSGELHDRLRSHFKDDPGIVVVVEGRRGERRRGDRRQDEQPHPPDDRRSVRNTDGRRFSERRAATVEIEAPPLPRFARAHLAALSFIERLEPTSQRQLDLDSARLVARAQAGDKSAMPELYLRHFDSVYTYLRVALRDQHEAEDAAQDVFLKAMQALPRYEARKGTPFRAWLFRIARNEVISRLRKKRWVEVEDPEDLDRRRATSQEPDVTAALAWVRDADLMFLLERLPIVQRQVITLRYMLELTVEEMATVLGRTPEAVRQVEYRARRTLEERLVAVRERQETERKSASMLARVRQLPVVTSRRFVLTSHAAPAMFSRHSRH